MVALSGLAGCDEPPATNEAACSNVCSCTEDPFAQYDCDRQCVPLLESFQVPQVCLNCLADLTCTELAQNGCDAECNAFSLEELP